MGLLLLYFHLVCIFGFVDTITIEHQKVLTFNSSGDNVHWVYCDGILLGHASSWEYSLSVIIPQNCTVSTTYSLTYYKFIIKYNMYTHTYIYIYV